MITPPPLLEATPGTLITAEAWNNLRSAVLMLFDAINATPGTLTVQVRSKADNTALAAARVTLVPTGDTTRPFRAAQFAAAGVQLHQVLGLLPGTYDMVVEAEGFATETRPVVVDAAGSTQALSVDLSPSEVTVRMPNLFGVAVGVAIKQVASAGLVVARVIDSYGTDQAPASIPDEARNAPVLNQVPEAGLVVPSNTPVQLHISAKVAQQVKVPNLAGLTLTEAKQQLAALGLTLGDTNTLGI